MSGRQMWGYVCLLFAVALFLSGVLNILEGKGPSLVDSSGVGVSYAVGAFLPSVVVLIIGLKLISQAKEEDWEDEEDDD